MNKLIPDEPYELSAEAAKLVNTLNGEWDGLHLRRQNHQAEGERLAAIPALSFSAADLKAKQRYRFEAVELLQLEIAILKRLSDWRTRRSSERAAALDRVTAQQEQAASVVLKKLVASGFDPGAAAEIFDDPDVRYKAKLAAQGALESVAQLHPSVLPHRKLANRLEDLRFFDHDLSPTRIDAMVAAAESKLKELIAAL